MALYELGKTSLKPIARTSLNREAVREREDLQRILRDQVEVLDPELLVIAEEFGNWDDSRRRIDLLAVDRAANLVVIELKRGDTGGHMELQAVRYAAMVSTMTWDRAVEAFSRYLVARARDGDPRELLLNFFDWEDPDEEAFGQDVRIILVSADFGRELTTAVLWLNERDLDIRCVRLRPFADDGRVLLNVEQVIPLPEAQDFQIQIREKVRQERKARTDNRDLTRFDLEVAGSSHERLPKRIALFRVVERLVDLGVAPETVAQAAEPRPFERVFRSVDGELNEIEFNQAAERMREEEGKTHDRGRFFTADDELFRRSGKTYALSKMWGGQKWYATMERLKEDHPEAQISFSPAE
jgi:hypothetical protein